VSVGSLTRRDNSPSYQKIGQALRVTLQAINSRGWKMKVHYNLKNSDKLILLVLYEAGKLSFKELEKIISALNIAESNFGEFVRTIAGEKEEYGYLKTPIRLSGTPIRRSEVERDVEGLEFLGLLKRSTSIGKLVVICNDTTELRVSDIELTEEGKRVAKSIKEGRRLILRPRPQRRTSIFVACAFGHDEIDRLYDEEYKPACSAFGYEPIRVDMTEPPQTVTESIVEGINESACVLADLTYARPSVYFEVGFAHGLGIPLVLTCRSDHHRGKDDRTRVHFDLEQYKISFWSRKTQGHFRWPKGMKPVERLASIISSLKKGS
jgi:hypothetical protein